MPEDSPIDLERFRLDLDRTRGWLGLSWNSMASMAGVSAAMFTRLNNGSSITLDTFAQLCGACRLNPADYMPASRGRSWNDVRDALNRVPGLGPDAVDDIVDYAKARIRTAQPDGDPRPMEPATVQAAMDAPFHDERAAAWNPVVPDPDPAIDPTTDGTGMAYGIGI